MPTLEVVVTVKQDGVPLPNFPIVRRIVPNEANDLAYAQASGASFVQLPGITALMTSLQALILTADQSVNVQVNNNGGVPLNPGGILIILDGNITASLFCAVQNNSGNQANLKGLVAGA